MVLIKVRFESLDGEDHDVEIAYDPQLYNDGSDDVGWTRGHALLSHDSRIASALVARPALTRTSSGYKGHTDDLLEHTYDALRPGNVVQQAHTRLTGRGEHRDLTLAIGFAHASARRRCRPPRPRSTTASTPSPPTTRPAGWSTATSSSRPRPPRSRCWPSTRRRCSSSRPTRTRTTRARSSRRRRCRGAGASCASTPTTRARRRTTSSGRATSTRSPPRCWPRATRPRPTRALDFLFDEQQLDDGSFPQNSQVDGTPKWKGLQMDQVGLPIVLAWQLGRTAARDWRHIRKAADFIVENGPDLRAGALGEPGGLLAGHDRGRDRRAGLRGGDRARQRRRRAGHHLPQARPTRGPRNVQRWTATTNGPYSDAPYYLRVTKDHRTPTSPTKYAIGDSGPVGRRPAPRGRPELPRAGPARRSSAPDDPVDPQHAQGRRRAAAGRRGSGTATASTATASAATAARGGCSTTTRAARSGAPGRSSPASAASTSCSPGRPASALLASDGPDRQRRRDAPRAGLGRARADRQTRLQAGGRDVLGDAAGLDARAARPARLVGRGGQLRSSARRSWSIATRAARARRYPSLPTSRRSGVFLCRPAHSRTHDSRSTPVMARGDVRIAVTLACEDCKRRNYQTKKSKRNNPDRITLRKYCKWCRCHTGHRETR